MAQGKGTVQKTCEKGSVGLMCGLRRVGSVPRAVGSHGSLWREGMRRNTHEDVLWLLQCRLDRGG